MDSGKIIAATEEISLRLDDMLEVLQSLHDELHNMNEKMESIIEAQNDER